MMGGCPPTHPPWYGLDGLGGSPAPPCGAVGLWCVPGLFRKSDRERIKRERKQERDRENQERRSKTSKDIKRRIPKIIEKTKENQLKNKRKRNGTLKIIWKAP